MNDLEISKALALAIGWNKGYLIELHDHIEVWWYDDEKWEYEDRIFDYRDWNVIGPIAERYDCFPIGLGNKSWNSRFMWRGCGVCANTPQKAIAMAVIGAKK